MSKKLYLIGNFEMNSNKAELMPYLELLKKNVKDVKNIVGICVPYVYLPMVSESLKDTKVLFGAENTHYKTSGAYTGEVSVEMLQDFNTKLVILGHSERRTYYNETNESVNLKLIKVLESNITPIVCIGESLVQRENGEAKSFVEDQLKNALLGVDESQLSHIIFAYEPIWAIGTGKTATNAEAEEMIAHIKEYIRSLYPTYQGTLVVLYGGSMNDANAKELLSMPSIDGGLIGGACLNAEKFSTIFHTNIEK